MIRRPPRSTRTDTLFPYTTLFRPVLRVRVREPGRRQGPVAGRAVSGDGQVRGGDLPLLRLVREVDHWPPGVVGLEDRPARFHHRSEEHTSELQSLMRISYAVFCLKKKKNNI